MPEEQREEFERRLLALVRYRMDGMDEDYPDGWEISEFVITARYHTAPQPGTTLDPWAGGPYPGWGMNGFTLGSSPTYFHDAELLQDALDYTLGKRNAPPVQSDGEDEPEDEGES
jgi:hypothetical protein